VHVVLATTTKTLRISAASLLTPNHQSSSQLIFFSEVNIKVIESERRLIKKIGDKNLNNLFNSNRTEKIKH